MLTRNQIRDAISWVSNYMLHENTIDDIRSATVSVLRNPHSQDVTVNLQGALLRLHEKRFEYFEDIDGCWAMTDGETVWLNRCKHFTTDDLQMTVLHEVLHDIVKYGGAPLSEFTEHRMMAALNVKLI